MVPRLATAGTGVIGQSGGNRKGVSDWGWARSGTVGKGKLPPLVRDM